MFRSIAYLSLNPNLTQEQFEQAAEREVENFDRLCTTATEGMRSLPPELRAQYLSLVLPILFSY